MDALELKRTEGLNRPFSLCGRHCYLMGFQDGSFPDYGWHTIGEMGGIWTHPIKIADGFWVSIETREEGAAFGYKPSWEPHMRHWLGKCDEFVLGDGGAWVEHRYNLPQFNVVRRQFIPHDEPAVGIEIDVTAKDGAPKTIQLNVLVRFDILPVWCSGWPNPLYLEAEKKDGKIICRAISDYMVPADYGRWTAALGCDTEPTGVTIGETLRGPEQTAGNGISALLKLPLTLDPSGRVRLALAGNLYGEKGAVEAVDNVLRNYDASFQKKVGVLRHIANEKTVAETPEKDLDEAFLWSKLNLEWLMQHTPILGTGAVAGHLDFPWYFGIDTDLSVGGFLAAGLHDEARDALRVLTYIGKKYKGRIPHELVTNGGVYSWGQIPETCLFEKCVWDTYLWTGDEAFLKEMYPVCRAGMLEHVPSQPTRDGILLIECEDLPDSRRDKSCPNSVVVGYASVAKMAEQLGDEETAKRCRELAEHYRRQVEDLFWVEEAGFYASRLDDDNKPGFRLDPDPKKNMHPGIFEGVGYTAVGEPSRVLRALEACDDPILTNDYGLYFDKDRQFNMPITTGCAAIAEFNYGRLGAGMRFLRMMARTVGYTMPGAAPEYIDANGDPEKADPQWCYLQLWSAALYVEALVLGVLRLKPDAARGKVTMTPRLPEGWPYAEFKNLTVGRTRFSVRIDGEKTTVTHIDGPELDIQIL